MKNLILSTFLALGLSFSSIVSANCTDVSGTYRCNPTDAPGVFTTTLFVQSSNLLSIIDISKDGTKTTTDEFILDGGSHVGAFNITYTAICRGNNPLKIIMGNIFVQAVVEYIKTNEGLTIRRNDVTFMNCTK